jgi:hypothetical protein
MNVKMVAASCLLIACATGLPAQTVSADTSKEDIPLTVTDLTRRYRSEYRAEHQRHGQTNAVLTTEPLLFYQRIHSQAELLPGSSQTQIYAYEAPAKETKQPGSNRLQVASSNNIEPESQSKGARSSSAENSTNVSVFCDFTGNYLLDLTKPVTAKPKSATGTSAPKKVSQMIVIESENTHGNILAHEVRIPEGGYDLIPPEPAWYEWFEPQMILTRLLGYWTSGTPQSLQSGEYWTPENDAPPVVLLTFEF